MLHMHETDLSAKGKKKLLLLALNEHTDLHSSLGKLLR